ncbi:hypothetical protein M407DRAFT_32105 [Tulasnella calospora MUT 4182]|uniref:Uncharacterized protein n=1 Tax=Tulasnella calospora MUT 4182 TaxID=1051891 RepID=A0A0C3Q4I8_9AGAM|nr:hypothetical protein M407DRAFT_32105 [Tulasnella calospora MUT 4182]
MIRDRTTSPVPAPGGIFSVTGDARLQRPVAWDRMFDVLPNGGSRAVQSPRAPCHSESSKSTCLKQFQLLHAPASFTAERDLWKAIIYLNLVKPIRKVLDAISHDDDTFSDDGDNSPTTVKPPSKEALRSGTPISFFPDEDPNSPEQLLIKRLAGPDEEEATQFGSWAPHPTSSTSRIKEVFVQSSSNWKRGLFSGGHGGAKGKEGGSGAEGERKSAEKDDPFGIVNACRDNMVTLWKDQSVQGILRRKGLEEMPGLYLNDIPRITTKTTHPPTKTSSTRA